MGIPTCKHADARNRDEQSCGYDRGKAPPRLCKGRKRWLAAHLTALFAALWLTPTPGHGETIRIATYNVELSRAGPGLLLRDILRREDEQITAVAEVVAKVAPDILLLQNVDYDLGLHALSALRDVFAAKGMAYPHILAVRPNSGMATGLDLDGDGRLGEAEDNQGFGFFAGEGGMALLSRFPIDRSKLQDFTPLLWRDLPGATVLPAEYADVVRLAANGQWVVPVRLGDTDLHILALHASPPVFDGPEDRNGKRNKDELRFWQAYLDGVFGPAPDKRFVLLGDANIDPVDGDGLKAGIRALLSDPRLQDPTPARIGPALQQNGQIGAPELDTVEWPLPDPGRLRVDFVLPSVDLRVRAAGVYWPKATTPEGEAVQRASRHRPVWVDLWVE